MTDTSTEAVMRHIERCWLTDPEPDRTETILRALAAERDALQAENDALRAVVEKLAGSSPEPFKDIELYQLRQDARALLDQ